MSKRARLAKKSRRERAARLQRLTTMSPERRLQQRLDAGRAEILFRDTLRPKMKRAPLTEEQKMQVELAAARGFRTGNLVRQLDPQTRNELISDLLVDSIRVARERRGS